MTGTMSAPKAESRTRTPLLEARNVSKYFGAVVALEDVSLAVSAGEVVCLLGDNGAGKSTLIKILSGVFEPDGGTLAVDGKTVRFGSPRDALDAGVATGDPDQAVGPLSGGERQTLAIARAEHFGARVLILDEPTSALGVKESAIVLRHVIAARNRGLGVIFITHNVQHALPIGDTFTILSRGRHGGTFRRAELDLGQLHRLMGGGEGFAELQP